MLQISFKWVGPLIFDVRGIDAALFATTLAVATLVMSASTKIAGSRYALSFKTVLLLLIVVSALFAFASVWWVVIMSLVVAYGLHGSVRVVMTDLINAHAEEHVRASVNSVESLLSRLLVVGYMPLVGYFLGMPQLVWMYGGFTLCCILTAVVAAWISVPNFHEKCEKRGD